LCWRRRFRSSPRPIRTYEAVLLKNATLTGASYNTTDFNHVDYDVSATAVSGGTIVLRSYVSSTAQGRSTSIVPTGLQLRSPVGRKPRRGQ
jgi:hypothetical protein